MKKLDDFTLQRYMRDDGYLECGHCLGRNVEVIGESSTMVGGGKDANHVWKTLHCVDCHKKSVRETKRGYVWYTSDGVVLRGRPACFERYFYTCAKCSGRVHREYRNKDGVGLVQYIQKSIGDPHDRNFRVFWVCAGCGMEEETEEEY